MLPTKDKFDVVCAVGVMFHIVDDHKWEDLVERIASSIVPGGLLIVGGYFGLVDGLNVQVINGEVNKRLRSWRRWRGLLKKNGFERIVLRKNNAYLRLKWLTPESNIIFAVK